MTMRNRALALSSGGGAPGLMSSQGKRVQNSDKKQSGRQKRTHMTGAELTRIQAELLFAPRDMCCVLGLPRRTYQDYKSGRRGIPRDVADLAREILRRNREFMARLPALITAAVERDFPGGVIPAHTVEREDDEWE